MTPLEILTASRALIAEPGAMQCHSYVNNGPRKKKNACPKRRITVVRFVASRWERPANTGIIPRLSMSFLYREMAPMTKAMWLLRVVAVTTTAAQE